MYNHRHSKGVWKKNYFKAGEMVYHAPEDRYSCSNNALGKQMYEKVCSSHSISTKALKTLVLETIKKELVIMQWRMKQSLGKRYVVFPKNSRESYQSDWRKGLFQKAETSE